MTLREELEEVLSGHDRNFVSSTPDDILADYLVKALHIFNEAQAARDQWLDEPPKRPLPSAVVTQEIKRLEQALDAWPGWFRETLYENSDEHGIIKESVCLPIRAAIKKLNKMAMSEHVRQHTVLTPGDPGYSSPNEGNKAT